jgi:conjugal transfer ATP-binding protein TraC
MYAGIDFLIVDPEDEYRRLCQQVGGQYIRLASSSGQHLNPFDLPPLDDTLEEGRDPLAEQVAALIALVEVMVAEPGRPLSVAERAALDAALYQTYAQAGISADPATHEAAPPLLSDFHAVLAAMPGELPASLAERLRRYVSGSLSGLFAGPTNVDLQNHMVVFNIQALEPELRPIAIHLIASFVWNRVRRSRQPRLLVIDEAWALMQYPEGAAFLASMARRARKYYLGLQVITQDVADFLGSEHGRTVLANAAIKVLMQQDDSSIEAVARAFRLSDRERQVLLTAKIGSGLFFVRGGHLGIHVVASPGEHEFITTSPRELAAQQAGAAGAAGREAA